MSGKSSFKPWPLFNYFPSRFILLINKYFRFLPPPPMNARCGFSFSILQATGRRGRERGGGRGGKGGAGLVHRPANYPSVPFLLGALAWWAEPSGCWPSLRGGIRSLIRSRPRASSKLRIFLVGEKPWMAAGHRADTRGRRQHAAEAPRCSAQASQTLAPWAKVCAREATQTSLLELLAPPPAYSTQDCNSQDALLYQDRFTEGCREDFTASTL